jgi:hypothetical protein
VYDYAAIVADFEAFLLEDGRSSHGTDFLTRKLTELRAAHRIDESADAAFLRRFGAHLSETFLGLVPASATLDPLPTTDPRTAVAMDEGAASDHPHEGSDACPPTPRPSAVSSFVSRRTVTGRPVPATR